MPRKKQIPWSELTAAEKKKRLDNHKEFRRRQKLGESATYVPRGTKLNSEQKENLRLWLELGIKNPGTELL